MKKFLKAVEGFDTEFGTQFSTYAVPLILGEIKRFFRDDGMVKVSRGIKENAQLIKKKNEEFVKKNGREPTILEIAELTGLSKEEIVMAMESCYEVESIYQPVFKNDGSEMYLVDKISDETDVPEETETQETVPGGGGHKNGSDGKQKSPTELCWGRCLSGWNSRREN